MPNIISIDSSEIRQIDGLYSLNDFHKASGNEAKHQPNRFIRNEQTQALISEIDNYPKMGSLKTIEGRNGGTYACRELVIAYAAWISAAFHLKVIRAFLDAQAASSQKSQIAPTPYNPMIPADKPNLGNTRWCLNISCEGQATMSIIQRGALMQTREELIENIQEPGGMDAMFDVDYVQRLAVACVHRLDKEIHRERSIVADYRKDLKRANERARELGAA